MAPMGVSVSRGRVLLCILLTTGMIYYLYSRFGSSGLRSGETKVDLRQLLSLAIRAAEEGGKAVREVKESDSLHQRSKGKTKEGADEMVTSGDLLSHRRMTSLFSNTFPGIKLISEEHDNAEVDKSLTWNYEIPTLIQESIDARMVPTKAITIWIDPLDATQEYTEDLKHFVTTMVCIAVRGKPIIGVIHKPFSKYTGYKVLSLLDTREDIQPDSADLYIHVTFIKKWDICAGNAILKALGGQMTTIDGNNIDYSDSPSNTGGLVATVGIDHHALLKRLPDLKNLAPKM
ncbi:inositol monophosphatase 3 isoform X2 [Stegostoma tigrinum]|uniref:inositol monophosphatase 3 isoform X2 n=1 Tax=Stegostoma tigrinum TaxID=3053191 RepID=UPI00202B91DE|nr:inositol monophosphatase 3 isoform X2 [Stegostoma tigrinum]